MEQTIVFSGWDTTLGLWGAMLGGLVAAVCGVGCFVGVALGGENVQDVRRGLIIGGLVFVAGVAACAWYVHGRLTAFESVEVDAEGTWIARNGLGVELGRFPADAPRSGRIMREQSGGVRTQWQRTWPVIEAGGQVLSGVHGEERARSEANDAFWRMVQADAP